MICSIQTFGLMILSIMTLSIVGPYSEPQYIRHLAYLFAVSCILNCYAECWYAECFYAECRYTVCWYAECCYGVCSEAL
jgi:hypothetical protein